MTFMVSTMIFISAFPTLGSAMTGYVANVQAFVNVTDGNLVPFNTFLKVCFIIHDGHRINQTDEFLVPCEVDTMHGTYSVDLIFYDDSLTYCLQTTRLLSTALTIRVTPSPGNGTYQLPRVSRFLAHYQSYGH
jgi:hypothetical protein